jgi:hypothetical protein
MRALTTPVVALNPATMLLGVAEMIPAARVEGAFPLSPLMRGSEVILTAAVERNSSHYSYPPPHPSSGAASLSFTARIEHSRLISTNDPSTLARDLFEDGG